MLSTAIHYIVGFVGKFTNICYIYRNRYREDFGMETKIVIAVDLCIDGKVDDINGKHRKFITGRSVPD